MNGNVVGARNDLSLAAHGSAWGICRALNAFHCEFLRFPVFRQGAGWVLLATHLNRHAPAESTWPLKNRPIHPRIIQIASSDDNHRLAQKSHLITTGLSQRRAAPARRFCDALGFECQFSREAHHTGKATRSARLLIWQALIAV